MKKGIAERQNESNMLDCQYAARYYYNIAERINKYVWVSSIMLVLFSVINFNSSWINIISVFVLDILISILTYLVFYNIKKATTLRAYFDSYVLDINIDKYTDKDLRNIKENIFRVVSKKKSNYYKQINNTGLDKPPGVKDWYYISNINGVGLKYDCQKQNIYWDEKLLYKRLGCCALMIVLIVGAFLLGFKYISLTSIALAILSSAGFIIRCAERLISNIKYIIISIKISGMVCIIDLNISEKNIGILQDEINNKRNIPIMGSNFIHKLRNYKITLTYKAISSNMEQ